MDSVSSTTYSGSERGIIVLRSSNQAGECQWDSWELRDAYERRTTQLRQGSLRVFRFGA